MFKSLIGEKVEVIVSSRSDNLLEYRGTLLSDSEKEIELSNVDIACLISAFQKGIFGDNIIKYKTNLEKVIINKKYIISCNK